MGSVSFSAFKSVVDKDHKNRANKFAGWSVSGWFLKIAKLLSKNSIHKIIEPPNPQGLKGLTHMFKV